MKRYILLFAFAASFAGVPSVARAAADTVEVRVSYHACDQSVGSLGDFARLKQITDKLGACAVSPGAGVSPVVLRVRGARGIADVSSTEYVPAEICEWELEGGDDADSSRTCHDASYYRFTGVPKGAISVLSTQAAIKDRFAAISFNPAFMYGNDSESLVSYAAGVASLNTAKDADGIITLHVFALPSLGALPGTASITPAEALDDENVPLSDGAPPDIGNAPTISDALGMLKQLLQGIGNALGN